MSGITSQCRRASTLLGVLLVLLVGAHGQVDVTAYGLSGNWTGTRDFNTGGKPSSCSELTWSGNRLVEGTYDYKDGVTCGPKAQRAAQVVETITFHINTVDCVKGYWRLSITYGQYFVASLLGLDQGSDGTTACVFISEDTFTWYENYGRSIEGCQQDTAPQPLQPAGGLDGGLDGYHLKRKFPNAPTASPTCLSSALSNPGPSDLNTSPSLLESSPSHSTSLPPSSTATSPNTPMSSPSAGSCERLGAFVMWVAAGMGLLLLQAF